MSQVSDVKKEATVRGETMQIEKMDVTDPKDREKEWGWSVDILVNNAAVKEGGALADITEENLRHQFEVITFAQIFLTQGFVKRMVQRRKGRIVFITSVSGFMADPFSGPYSGSKHALEAFAE